MKKPILVIMAAGMGSRYGGLKQIDPVDQDGHIIIDFSLYDAKRAGFETVVFVIKKENEDVFKETIGKRIEGIMNVYYVFQELNDIPSGYQIPKERVKPWGTAHAIYCCRNIIDGPFAVINADDYYGVDSFQIMYEYLAHHQDNEQYHWAMVGFRIENTLTENGTVARGICKVDNQHRLVHIIERTKIKKADNGAVYEDDGQWIEISKGTTVSMNLWGFSKNMIKEIGNGFETFLDQELKNNPLKCEYFIPSVVSSMLKSQKATVEVLTTPTKWYGVTYKEDKPVIVNAVQKMKDDGIYPQKLWGEICG